MEWTVLISDEFEPEYLALPRDVQDEVLAMTRLLQHSGPHLGRPHVDTLKDSKHANMRKCGLMPQTASGVWLSLSIPSAGRSCSWRGTSRGEARSDFTAG